jgi:hypothetical protein
MMLAVCVTHYHELFGEATDHMQAFFSFIKLMAPDTFIPPMERETYDAAASAFLKSTPKHFFRDLFSGEFSQAFPNLLTERVEDSLDNDYYDTPFELQPLRK